jgi:hypothetical protein
MKKETGKQVWVAPKLEKVEMVDTQNCTNNNAEKNNPVNETGKCGSGLGS